MKSMKISDDFSIARHYSCRNDSFIKLHLFFCSMTSFEMVFLRGMIFTPAEIKRADSECDRDPQCRVLLDSVPLSLSE